MEDHGILLALPVQPNARPKPQASKVTDINNATLEHIYLQNAKAADRVADLDAVRHFLGNLTFFGEADNVATGNKSFAVKQTAYERAR